MRATCFATPNPVRNLWPTKRSKQVETLQISRFFYLLSSVFLLPLTKVLVLNVEGHHLLGSGVSLVMASNYFLVYK